MPANGVTLQMNVTAMVSNLMSLATQGRQAAEGGLLEFGHEEMAESQRRVPVDKGILRDSGQVEEPVWANKERLSLEMGYGGAADEYAIVVHEDTEAFHEVGEAKFLESTLNESAPHIADRVGAKVQARMGL